MAYDIIQGKITHYTNKAKRICSILQIPNHYVISEVRIPRTLMAQSLHQERSISIVGS